MCRRTTSILEFFLIHPGGPFWSRKNDGAWSIPKGIVEQGETIFEAAQREFFEETGIQSSPPFHEIGSLKTKAGKMLHVWTFEGHWDPEDGITSNMISIEFPYRSGKYITIPEADKAEWMDFERASKLINASQLPFLESALKHYTGKG